MWPGNLEPEHGHSCISGQLQSEAVTSKLIPAAATVVVDTNQADRAAEAPSSSGAHENTSTWERPAWRRQRVGETLVHADRQGRGTCQVQGPLVRARLLGTCVVALGSFLWLLLAGGDAGDEGKGESQEAVPSTGAPPAPSGRLTETNDPESFRNNFLLI